MLRLSMAFLASLFEVSWCLAQAFLALLALLPIALLVAAAYVYRALGRAACAAPIKHAFRAGADWYFEKDVGLDYDSYTFNWSTPTFTLHNLKLPSEGFVIGQLQVVLSLKVCSVTVHHFALPNPPPPPGLEAWKVADMLHIGHIHVDFGGFVGRLRCASHNPQRTPLPMSALLSSASHSTHALPSSSTLDVLTNWCMHHACALQVCSRTASRSTRAPTAAG